MSGGPIPAREFARLMARFAPFETAPVISVATSGGADSLALALLAAGWARRLEGRAVALTVDHGLRPGAAAEARQTGRWLARRDIEHHVLRWRGEKPTASLQAAAREARYRLLAAWCRRRQVLHLLLAHHLEDQAETFLLRLGRGSGVDGLAAMAPSTEREGVRLLRPLLEVPKARLRATLTARDSGWLEDPSNRDPAFARTRARRALTALAPLGITAPRLAATARRLARARQAIAAETNELLAQAAGLDPAGYCRLDPRSLANAPEEVGLRALARVLTCVSGAAYPPRLARLERLYATIRTDTLAGGRTLAGCRVARAGEALIVCREARAMAGAMALAPGAWSLWDGRFRVRLPRRAANGLARPRVAALGAEGWRHLRSAAPEGAFRPMPRTAALVVPALWDVDGLVEVPHLRYRAPGIAPTGGVCLDIAFRPAVPLGAGEGRTVVARAGLA